MSQWLLLFTDKKRKGQKSREHLCDSFVVLLTVGMYACVLTQCSQPANAHTHRELQSVCSNARGRWCAWLAANFLEQRFSKQFPSEREQSSSYNSQIWYIVTLTVCLKISYSTFKLIKRCHFKATFLCDVNNCQLNVWKLTESFCPFF